MTHSAITHTDKTGAAAGAALGQSIREQLGEKAVHALILFASPQQDHEALLRALHDECAPECVVGCTSAGEFTSTIAGTSLTCAVALHADDMRFTAGLGLDLRGDRDAAARSLLSTFTGLEAPEYQFRSALILTDALAGFADDLVDRLTRHSAGTYRFFGGGAGDDAAFSRTVVFCGTRVEADAVVGLEILSNKPIGIGVRHGWTPGGERMRVTEAEGMRLVSLNATPAVAAFEEHAVRTGQPLDRGEPMPFFLHNVIGLESDQGYRLRVPLGIEESGAIACAADIPEGSTACIMATTPAEAAAAAAAATRDAVEQLGSNKPGVALFFDCVATRLRLGAGFDAELSAVKAELGGAEFAGFNTYGQIARSEGQFEGFHNCTAVVCVIPA